MNTDTGRLYEAIGEDAQKLLEQKEQLAHLREFSHPDDGDLRTALVTARALGRQPNKDEQAMFFEAARGDNIVPVSEKVAQTVKLGQRELDRRAKRRKAAKASRKRNR